MVMTSRVFSGPEIIKQVYPNAIYSVNYFTFLLFFIFIFFFPFLPKKLIIIEKKKRKKKKFLPYGRRFAPHYLASRTFLKNSRIGKSELRILQ